MEYLAVAGTLIGVALGAILTYCLNNKQRRDAMKLDVLRRIVGYRYCLSEGYVNEGSRDSPPRVEMHRALNEAVIVFHSSPKVVAMVKDLGKNFTGEKLAALVKEMGKAANITFAVNPDNFIPDVLVLNSPSTNPKSQNP